MWDKHLTDTERMDHYAAVKTKWSKLKTMFVTFFGETSLMNTYHLYE